jgi:riboflavin biosynthesis pyrimidine reductase
MHPKVICHMVSSIDGRLLVDRWLKPGAKTELRLIQKCYDQLAAQFNADGWMVGRKTMEDYTRGIARTFDASFPNLRAPFVGNRNGRDVAVVIDLHGKLHYGQDNAAGDHVIAILSEKVSDDYLTELRQDGVSYLFITSKGNEGVGSKDGELRYAMNVLGETFGLKSLLLQGGGITNGSFLKAGLIDEISLLVYPGIDGLAGSPSIFEYMGTPDERPAAGQSLRHISTETLNGGMVWIRYQIEKDV